MPRPNILLITCDQLRYDFLGYAGNQFVDTPNIDALAKSGVVFSNCFSNSPVCTPARIGMATGIMPSRLGSLTNNCYLEFSTPTYYQHLRDHGYYVGCVGKLDLAKPEHQCGLQGNLPRTYTWGFTHPVECMGRMDTLGRERLLHKFEPADPYTAELEKRDLLETFHKDMLDCKGADWLDQHLHDSYLPADAWEDTFIADRSAQWIEDIPREAPWHLFVSFVGPHDPFNPPTEYADQFRNTDVGDPIPFNPDGKPEWIRKKAENNNYSSDVPHKTRRQYAACIKAIDDGIGKIVEALKARGMLDNTIIMFTADHGEMLLDHNLIGKSVAYEPSIHVPFFVCGPGIDGNRTSSALTELIDIPETICDLAGTGRRDFVDGLSVDHILSGKGTEHRSHIVSSLHSWNTIRTETHKLVDSINDTPELYDLESDPNESVNVFDSEKERSRALSLQMKHKLMEGKCRR